MAGDDPHPPTPLARKLGVKAGHRVAFLHAPADWSPQLPDGVTTTRRPGRGRSADLTIAFFRSRRDVERAARGLAEKLPDAAVLWIAWPRRAGGHESDITENALREIVLPTGLVDVKVAALSEDWSGLKFVRRRELRQPAR